jgi:predicted RNase H-like HicB family nuclease
MRTRYKLIIYWSKEDDSFVVEVPELPGCMADDNKPNRACPP